MDKIEMFVKKLAESDSKFSGNFINIYGRSNPNNQIREENLRLYLEKMQKLDVKFILVGEAPGFRGCHFTGIPFTSEFVISNNKFFHNDGYGKTKENIKPKKEKTATMMWEALDKFNKYPLLWNAFPFYPHKQGNISEMRTPTKEELKIGLDFLNDMFELFPNLEMIGAVGRKAEDSLNNNHGVKYIPHPSHCKKIQFIEKLNKFFELT